MVFVGFTGTQHGMTEFQFLAFANLIGELRPDQFHHGDCVGADAQAHNIVRGILSECKIVLHLPDDPRKRAFCSGDRVRRGLPHLVRNRNIVLFSDVLIAAPRTREEELRSGTWSMIRFARKVGRKSHLLFPAP